MSRTGKYFGFALLLLALGLAGRGTAQDDKGKPPPALDTKQLTEEIQKLTKAFTSLTKRLDKDFSEIGEKLTTLDGALANTLKLEGDVQKLTRTVADLNSQLKALQDSYQRLDERLRMQDARIAKSFEPRPPEPRPNGTTGTIKLQNRSGVSATVVVDNRGYVLGPFETRLLENRPLGSFSYEVIAENFGVIQSLVTRTLTPEDVFVIQINPSR